MAHLEIAIEAAKAGAEVLKKFWGSLAYIEDKATAGDLVTEADKASEEIILKTIRGYFPDHAILAEESGSIAGKQSDYLWVIDPLDGTTNYAHQFPFCAVSIALLHKKIPIAGVVYNPFLNEMFSAAKGEGAFLNGKKIQVSATAFLEKSLLATGFAYDRRTTLDNNYAEFSQLTNLTQGVRRCGSAALDLAYVAAGRFDGYWERGIKPWDIAAGVLLVQEANGLISAYNQAPLDWESGRILATNGKIHQELSEILTRS